MFEFIRKGVYKLNNMLNKPKEISKDNIDCIESELIYWKYSYERKMKIIGEAYYNNFHDILKRKRTVIGEGGNLKEVDNLPNNKIIDNQYSKLVDQKVNYLFGKPFTFETNNDVYSEFLKEVFNKSFLRMFKNLGESAINEGLAWIHPYYDENGELSFKRFEAKEILPFWLNSDRTKLDFALRLYEVDIYEGRCKKTIEKVEIYSKNGVDRYILSNNKLIKDDNNYHYSYITIISEGEKIQEANWDKVPLIPFRYNNIEMPLIRRVKSLQDGLNLMISDFENNMQEDARNSILVLVNYDGQNLGEFRKNLSEYGAVKVKTVDGAAGDLKTLEIKVNSENYKAIIDIFKRAIIENGRGYDAKSDKMLNSPNQMNIQSMYSDIDLDANGMETEFQAGFEELIWFVNVHLSNTYKGDFFNEDVNITFNRDILINESEKIDNCQKSIGVISNKTATENHPWVDDLKKENERKEDEQENKIDDYISETPPNYQRSGDMVEK